MKTVIINRDFQDEKQSLGMCYVKDREVIFVSECIERGWMDNQKNISCIPTGCYKIVKEYSPKFETDLWEIKGVPNRSECKFHAANFARQLNGCIALGSNRIDIDGDGYIDITHSQATMKRFHEAMGDDVEGFLIINKI